MISILKITKGNNSAKRYNFHTSHILVVVALLFYVHGKHLRSCRDGQLT